MTKTILITGGLGFIGHHFAEHIHRTTNWNIIILDKVSYASTGFDRLISNMLIHSPRVKVYTWDLVSSLSVGMKTLLKDVNYVVHMAAETHVDNSIADPVYFVSNNVMSTLHILEYAREQYNGGNGILEKFFYFSTDEVFGPAPTGVEYSEDDRHKPTNPYSASKSASEMIVMGYENSYGLPIIITNLMNCFGERQHVEKFIPKCMKYILEGKTIPIHVHSDCITPGSRFYIHARNVATAVLFLIQHGTIGEKYNITGEREVNNLEMAQLICRFMNECDEGKDSASPRSSPRLSERYELKYELIDFHSDRPSHDHRYALCGEKLAKLGWSPPLTFEQSLQKTVEWTLRNREWLKE